MPPGVWLWSSLPGGAEVLAALAVALARPPAKVNDIRMAGTCGRPDVARLMSVLPEDPSQILLVKCTAPLRKTVA